MILNIEKSLEQDKECSQEWLVNMDPGDRWFDPQLGQYFVHGLMTVIGTGFITFYPLLQ